MTLPTFLHSCGILAVASPAILLLTIGLARLVELKMSERATARLTQVGVAAGLLGCLGMLAAMLLSGLREVPVEIGDWIAIESEHFHFHLKFVFDRLSVPFAILSFVLCGTVGAFAKVYLHREPGYQRFFLFYAVFLLGMVVSALAGTIETLFLGWELVGLSSALLIAYFQNRPIPVRNGLHVWVVYRIADAAFLVAALTLHHLTGAGNFAGMMGSGVWPESIANIDSTSALIVGLLLLVAAAGKSGMVPFSGWLPRAMEGPTPSSAIFYGALSVHLGAYLLLRVSPLLDVSMPLRIAVLLVGLASALFGAFTARVQTDVKSALAYASLTQLGIIVIEIGLGFRYLALIHIIGHALLRTLQLLRAPSLLQDYENLENAIGDQLPDAQPKLSPLTRSTAPVGGYRFCHERGFLDSALQRFVVRPFFKLFLLTGSLEDRWTTWLAGNQPAKDPARHHQSWLPSRLTSSTTPDKRTEAN
ncbi:proton-conducting transporter transmembrane domain-containing protein [Crateriforma conspicua]|uniref:NADH-quinone oxidoreductase subunit 12 n=1 Tax=Crateriforma conspicua TaxID=2527996 RepID=A0A5C5Y9J8_9PLAN|nr:proton-conducting transporter membrane subunit [Crateriforma conspicua]TWT71483.1 NADH-quinone oxidoreductase subunit 12 [Crateriforma conspicua]